MSIVDDAIKENRHYAESHDRKLALRPAPKIAVVTCMDPRLSNLPAILGLPQADIDVMSRSGRSDHILGLQRTSPCVASSSTWSRVY
jgi:carbonic anhydrase